MYQRVHSPSFEAKLEDRFILAPPRERRAQCARSKLWPVHEWISTHDGEVRLNSRMIKDWWISLYPKQYRRCHGKWEDSVRNACVGTQNTEKPQDEQHSTESEQYVFQERLRPRQKQKHLCITTQNFKIANDRENWSALTDYLCVIAHSLYWLHTFSEAQFSFQFSPQF